MKSSVERVLDLLKENFGERFTTYYNGDPEVIPRFNLPAVIVTQTRDDTTQIQFAQDDVIDEIRIKLLLDKADDYTGGVNPANLTDKRLRDLVAARNDSNGYKDGTVKKVLRESLLDGVTAVASTMTVEYGVNPRETLGQEGNVEWTAEAWVTFPIQYFVDTQ